jgi:hypothetical protein
MWGTEPSAKPVIYDVAAKHAFRTMSNYPSSYFLTQKLFAMANSIDMSAVVEEQQIWTADTNGSLQGGSKTQKQGNLGSWITVMLTLWVRPNS